MMKRFVCILILTFASLFLRAAEDPVFYGREYFTVFGQLFPGNENPYQRVDQARFSSSNKIEDEQLRMSSGVALCFRTNSFKISILAEVKKSTFGGNTAPCASKGVDLYIREGKSWKWAGCTTLENGKQREIISGMNGAMHECLLYLPIFTEISKVEIGVDSDAKIQAIDNPFDKRIAVYGGGGMQGVGSTRSGMAFPAQLSRLSGMEFINFGCYCKNNMAPFFAGVLADAEVDAYILDIFNNTSIKDIEAKLDPFIATIREKKPQTPIIIMQLLPRTRGNFGFESANIDHDVAKAAAAEVRKASTKYKNIHLIKCQEETDPEFESTSDGTYQGDYSTFLRAKSAKAQILDILKPSKKNK